MPAPDLITILTEATCGEACWSAREDICRCSCGGANHGCLRDENGVRPVRTSKIDGYMYELQGVGDGVEKLAQEINEKDGVTFLYAATSRDSMYRKLRAKLRTPTMSQIQKWPELAAYRNLDRWDYKPYLLWVRVDQKTWKETYGE